MKCPNPACRAENPDEATFCRACGRKFLLIDRSPEFKFTSISPNTPWPTNIGVIKTWRNLLVLAFLIMLAIIGYCVYSYKIFDIQEGTYYNGENYIEIEDFLHWSSAHNEGSEYTKTISRYREPFIVYGVLASIGALLLLFLITCVNKVKSYTTNSYLSDIADYVQKSSILDENSRITNRNVFSIYIKESKFGILDLSEKKVIFSHMFDEVRYLIQTYPTYLKVRVNNSWGIVKIYPKPGILVPPTYDTIELVDKQRVLFQCTLNGKTLIIDAYGRIRE